MRPILFLDFDGPIFSDDTLQLEQNQGQTSKDKCQELDLHVYIEYWYANPKAISFLNKMYELYPYDLVVSSSWADSWLHEKKHIEALLNINGLKYNLHQSWSTPRGPGYASRAQEISGWLYEHQYVQNNYIVLDDLVSGKEFALSSTYEESNIKKDQVFLASIETGFSDKDFEAIEAKLLELHTQLKLKNNFKP